MMKLSGTDPAATSPNGATAGMGTLSPRLRRLDERLAALPLDCEAMLLSELDGYVAGVLVCPDLVLPSEWLPSVWGRDEEEATPVFDSAADAQALTGLVMQHYNTVARDLGRGRDLYTPLFDVDERHDEVLWEVWIGGFERAMALRPESWAAVFQSGDEDTVTALGGLAVLVRLAGGDKEGLDVGQDAIDDLTRDAPDLIPHWIEALHAWRLKTIGRGPSAAARTKIGRNDPCPCGSGRKHKKCCGLN